MKKTIVLAFLMVFAIPLFANPFPPQFVNVGGSVTNTKYTVKFVASKKPVPNKYYILRDEHGKKISLAVKTNTYGIAAYNLSAALKPAGADEMIDQTTGSYWTMTKNNDKSYTVDTGGVKISPNKK